MKIVIVTDDLLGDEETHQALLDAVAASGGVCHLDTGIERIQVRLLGVVEAEDCPGDQILMSVGLLEGA